MRAASSLAAARAEIVRKVFEQGWNHQRFAEIEPHLAERTPFTYNGRSFEVDPDDLPKTVARWRTGFPDLRMHVHEVVAAEDLVAVRLELTGTHLGPWEGVPASGNRVRVAEMMMFRFEGERIVELWEMFDELGLREQIAADPRG